MPPATTQHALLRLEYDGTRFSGWSRQPGERTVEQCLRDAFAASGCTQVDMRCAGRTDAGVHATGQVISATYHGSIPPDRISRAFDARVPRDMVVLASAPCVPGFDARRDCTSRAYEYRVLARRPRSPERTLHVLHHPRPLDLARLDEMAAAIAGKHDFRAFTPSRTLHSFFHRTVLESRWVERGDELVYQVRANAFLRNMVRVLVGTMLEAARGDRDVEQVLALLEGAPRSRAGRAAPPRGLCLVDASYDDALPRWHRSLS